MKSFELPRRFPSQRGGSKKTMMLKRFTLPLGLFIVGAVAHSPAHLRTRYTDPAVGPSLKALAALR